MRIIRTNNTLEIIHQISEKPFQDFYLHSLQDI